MESKSEVVSQTCSDWSILPFEGHILQLLFSSLSQMTVTRSSPQSKQCDPDNLNQYTFYPIFQNKIQSASLLKAIWPDG